MDADSTSVCMSKALVVLNKFIAVESHHNYNSPLAAPFACMHVYSWV